MSEPVTALNGATYAGVARIAELPRRGMITIRGSQESAALVAAVGAASGGLDMPGPGEAVIAADRMLGWMSPDELLLMLPPAEVAGALAALAEGMAGEHYLAVEVTDARALFSISGEGAVAREVLARLNPNFKNLRDPVSSLSGGQRQVIAIARAIYFDTKILIMDEPTAALGPSETAMVADLIRQLRAEGIGIFLVSHDMHDVFDLCDRVVVMNKGKVVGAHAIEEVSKDDVLSLIVKGELPADWSARNLEAAQ